MEISIETFLNLIVHYGFYVVAFFLYFQFLRILVDTLVDTLIGEA